MSRTIYATFFIFVLILLCSLIYAGNVLHAPASDRNLIERWNWGVREGQENQRNGFWIGYSIKKLMEPNEFFISGSHFIMSGHIHTDSNSPTLEELITGKKILSTHKRHPSNDEIVRDAAREALEPEKEQKGSAQKIWKDVGLIFEFPANGSGQIRTVEISNITFAVDLNGRQLIWLGFASNEQSLELLQKLYKGASSAKLKEEILDAFGSHEKSQLISNFLRQILQSNEPEQARGMAAYWLGHHDQNAALPLLVQTIHKDRSSHVRTEVLNSISEMETPDSLKALVGLAKNAPEVKLRKDALYSLAETKSPEAFSLLEQMVYQEPNDDVRKEALYALAEFASSTSSLVKIAKSHPETEIRKETLYLLAERKTSETLQLLEYLALKDPDEDVRKEAMYALSEVPNGGGVPALIKIARTHPDMDIRKEAVEILGESKDPRARAALLQIVTDP